MKPDPKAKQTPAEPEEFAKFRDAVRSIVAVPKKEIERRDKARKKRRKSA